MKQTYHQKLLRADLYLFPPTGQAYHLIRSDFLFYFWVFLYGSQILFSKNGFAIDTIELLKKNKRETP